MSQRPLLSLSLEEFSAELETIGLEPFRARQVWEWIFQKQVFEFDAMTNLSKDARAKLTERFPSILPREAQRLVDPDGTVKIAAALADGERVEAVALPGDEEEGLTFCLSTQAGCPIGCAFCRTGAGGFRRHLTRDEILLQVLMLIRAMRRKPTNIVFMGMGEPFLNRVALFGAIDVMTNPKGLGLATRRITISTAGVVDGIRELAERPGEVNLAVSLHVADDKTRDRLVPINRKYPLAKLRAAVAGYIERTGRRVTFEVVLLKQENDQLNDALNLAAFCEGLTCHVNLLRFNAFPGSPFKPSDEATEKEFRKVLKKAGIPVTVRRSRGQTILAACGQLSGKTGK
ncbi:MAG TPA: 23S rRNA (adenine(2503)-C(2))-methyltransferase RlmN [Candidatus Ozemobacteraceae bacterium]|nr:23S rRNA (adenine(2503)-C(2))-methyltransferase RlmN [Candidatus Ozemobacteraceae bacterium]